MTHVRRERDLLGELQIDAGVFYGVHTARAIENFQISGTPISTYPGLIKALATVKQAAAIANEELGLLDSRRASAIIEACKSLRRGEHHAEFAVDVIQGGAGTSTNMNANEVIANLALQGLGKPLGDYEELHPLEHVNLGQSTNDVYPTALKLALLNDINSLRAAMGGLAEAFREKALEFRDVLKVGRTQLQDAVPMTLGQEFAAYALSLEEDRSRLVEAMDLLVEINLGGTAIGTRLNSHPLYPEKVRDALSTLADMSFRTAHDLVEATQDVGVFVQLSGVLKRTAVKLSKTCNDLRLLSSGPRVGLNEINLPAVQAGSSIMPGKVNPVIPEVVNQVAFDVVGNDVTITMAAEAGQLQLNAFEPMIALSLLRSIRHLTAACGTLETRCVRGIDANRAELEHNVSRSIGLVTSLAPHIGYANATIIAQRALLTNKGVPELVLEAGLLSSEELDRLLDPQHLIRPPSEPLVNGP